MTTKHRIYTMTFSSVYPLYIAKAEKKGRTQDEVDTVIRWLTGYTPKAFEKQLAKEVDFETFFQQAPQLNPARQRIKGVICGVRIEEIADPLMREIRYLDKLIDELARGKTLEKILRAEPDTAPTPTPKTRAKESKAAAKTPRKAKRAAGPRE